MIELNLALSTLSIVCIVAAIIGAIVVINFINSLIAKWLFDTFIKSANDALAKYKEFVDDL